MMALTSLPTTGTDEAPDLLESEFLRELRASLQQRMDELRPLVEEEKRLRAAMEELAREQRARR